MFRIESSNKLKDPHIIFFWLIALIFLRYSNHGYTTIKMSYTTKNIVA
ncbi:MAG: hypothetical protein AABX58_03425 [Thermoproteota archaeon]